jgi:hypothetical protein
MEKKHGIREILIVHHSHTDFGYTDLPSTTWDLHVEYIHRAIELCERTAGYPEAARFRWNCEVLWPVQRFMETASAGERRRFERAYENGQMDVGAMPFNTGPQLDAEEWRVLTRSLGDLYERFRPVVAWQNDVNGAPWGLIPRWLELGVEMYWTGPNDYSAPSQPSGRGKWWWWEGRGGERVLTHLGQMYNQAQWYFNGSDWRRGPTPASASIWYNPPEPGDIFGASPEALAESYRICSRMLERGHVADEFDFLALSATNMWRYDNDPPQEGLSDFVAGWNAAGYEPRLRLATLREVNSAAKLAVAKRTTELPALRGDWPDWWSDGASAPAPTEAAACQAARRRLTDLPMAEKMLEVESGVVNAMIARAWNGVSSFTEHTYGPADFVPQPYRWNSLGHAAETFGPVFKAEEQSRAAMTRLMRASPAYRPLSKTRLVQVFNPGSEAREGWVNIEAEALRFAPTVARDVENGKEYAIEGFGQEPYWGVPKEEAERPFEVPNDAWPFRVKLRRFRPEAIPAGGKRKFELVEPAAGLGGAVLPGGGTERGDGDDEGITFDPATGFPTSLRIDSKSGRDLLASGSPFGFGQLVFETFDFFGARDALLAHDPARLEGKGKRETPSLVEFGAEVSSYGPVRVSRFSHPACHGIEQRWQLLCGKRKLEVVTTLWVKEETKPQAIYMAFPMRLESPVIWYDSVGQATRVGHDQLPGTCGEYLGVGPGVRIESGGVSVVLATPDTPLVCFDAPAARYGRRTFVPETGSVFPLIAHNFWLTNCQITKASKLELRHVLQWGPTGKVVSPAGLAGELYAMPCVGTRG